MVLRVSHIVTLRHLLAHSVADLEMSLKRKNGVKFSFSVVDRRLWVSIGLAPSDDAAKKPPGPKAKLPSILPAGDVDDDDEYVDLFAEPEKRVSPAQLVQDTILAMAPLARKLLEAIEPSRFELGPLCRVHERLHLAVFPSAMVDVPEDVSEAVHAIDVVLLAGVENGRWAPGQIQATSPGFDAAVKHSRILAAIAASPRTDSNRPLEGERNATDPMLLATSILQASENARPLSDKDAKVAEELEASKQRAEAVSQSAPWTAALQTLAGVVGVQSEASDEQKLQAYAATSNRHHEVAALLKASHVRQPAPGTASAERVAIVSAWRAVRQGVHTAMLARVRELLHDDAVATAIVEAIMAGKLIDADDSLKIGSLHDASKPPPWLGGKNARFAQKLDGTAKDFVQLASALPALVLMMTEMHPCDASIGVTMAIVQAEMAKGQRVLAAADVVAGILIPLLREWSERWAAFQKSAASPLPTLGAAWAKVRVGRTVSAFMVRVENAPTHTATNPTASKEFASKGQLKSVDDQLKALRKQMASMSGDEDEDGEALTASQKRRKKKKEKALLGVAAGAGPAKTAGTPADEK